MAFQVRKDSRPSAGDFDGTVWVLDDGAGGAAEVAPSLGMNCFRWHCRLHGNPVELLYATPTFLEGDRPTRSGIPVLFPFPNRIRDGRYSWAGTTYQLPINGPQNRNSIHGFVCRHPWRVVDQGADAGSAWVTGEFQGSVDDPESLKQWPADYRIRLTVRLRHRRLVLDAVVSNPDSKPLPFGLGFHPYWRLLGGLTGKAEETLVEATAWEYWELQESLPTGRRPALDAPRDLRIARPYRTLQLDDVLTGLDGTPVQDPVGLCPRGAVREPTGQYRLQLFASPSFRDLVVFTPPHREAICLEPYTCTTDAINLQEEGIDAGLLVLPAGGTWTGQVEAVV